jgi:hypothetical protein
MRARQWGTAVALVAIVMVLAPGGGYAQNVDELRQRLQQLENSTREELESLKRMIREQEAKHEKERKAQEERERVVESLMQQMDEQRLSFEEAERQRGPRFVGWSNFFDLQAGRKQSNDDRDPLGKDIQGNVFTNDNFKVRLGGSLRLHVQHNDSPVGESVSRALLPDVGVPGGGNTGRGERENFRAFAGRSRLNLAIQGPDTLGGKTSAFFEMDFNQQANGAGEVNAVRNNPRLRHAYGQWLFPDVLVKGNELQIKLGQTGSFADSFPDTIDFNTLYEGLGAAHRRNPRIELVDRFTILPDVKLVASLGGERPLFDNQALGGGDVAARDLGSGDLSGFPALSGGIGLETGRLGLIGSTAFYARVTWGERRERFNRGTTTPNLNAQVNFQDRNFTDQVAHGTLVLDRIGFNEKGRAMTLKLQGGAVWTRGEGRVTDSDFDRRVILDKDGTLTSAQSVGAWVNPIFFFTDTLSLRWAGGFQTALDDDRPVVTGSLITDSAGTNFFRVNNRQSEISLWWTPGPFTFALGWNFTKTDFRNVNATGTGSTSRHNENNKFEFISWWSF